MKLAIPDLISPSYFPAVAAVELGFFKEEGLDVQWELIYPVDKCYEQLRDGKIDYVGGAAHAVLSAFPGWQGAKLLCAQGQGMYWFLVMHKSFGGKRGDLSIVKGKRIGAAPWVDMGLRQMLIAGGLDPKRDAIDIGPVPGAFSPGSVNFGLAAAKALEDRKVDGFWANGMGAEVAVRGGFGTVIVDVRRDAPKPAFDFTMATIAATERLIERTPDAAAGAIRAIAKTHRALKADTARATAIGKKLFPAAEAEVIAELIRRDLPYYDPAISEHTVAGINSFLKAEGKLGGPVAYDRVVAGPEFRRLWTA